MSLVSSRTIVHQCRICSAGGCACGGTSSPVTPVDELVDAAVYVEPDQSPGGEFMAYEHQNTTREARTTPAGSPYYVNVAKPRSAKATAAVTDDSAGAERAEVETAGARARRRQAAGGRAKVGGSKRRTTATSSTARSATATDSSSS